MSKICPKVKINRGIFWGGILGIPTSRWSTSKEKLPAHLTLT